VREACGVRVLVVDDHLDTASTMGTLFEAAGYQVRLAVDGVAAMDVFREFRPDVVFLDIGLPKLDGYAVAKQIRGEPGAQSVFIVMVSGYAQDLDRLRSIEAGANFHLAKPAAPEVLMEVLANWRRQQQVEAQFKTHLANRQSIDRSA
jgi:CheY-like chemotaxis protein